MGKATKLKNESLALKEANFRESFSNNYKKLEAKLAQPVPSVSEDFKEYEGFFIRSKESFVSRTKSKDRDKQRYEFVKHVFHKYPVPSFMFNAWETPYRPNQQYYRWEVPQRVNKGFATKDDYRFWYICIATGGSFYKEYGQYIFTKKESHLFLNCPHSIPINEAIIYAIAYVECGNTGKALRISKTKINGYTLTNSFWKEVVRFFARQEAKSVEELDDIIDFIVSKRADNNEFTIIGKGHTLDSLNKKVEEWHQDLRRLKLIGEQNWEGIPIKDSSYEQKDWDGSILTWKFTQIKSAKVLQQEGNAMRHCVFGYKKECAEGRTSIWSVTLDGNRKLTVEVQNGSVKQVRGLANRMAKPAEKDMVLRWARENRFYYK